MKDLTPLSDEEVQELWRLYRFYGKEARRCEDAKAYLAGCVMLGSALEALLILMTDAHVDEAISTGHIPKWRKKPKPLLGWELPELLKVAKAAGWLPSGSNSEEDRNDNESNVGDYAELTRKVRNLAHPGRYCKDHFQRRITERLLREQFEIVDACREWLAHHNAKSLLAHMEQDKQSSTIAGDQKGYD